ncbi:MAG: hypothetical protein GY953_07360, partial [bacterium]|nr:hypothetical protein [bacterium]
MLVRFLSIALVCVPVWAQLTAPPRVGVGVIQKQLSLAEAIEMAVRENLEIEIEKTGIASALAAERGATGFLDPLLGWSPRIEDRTTPTSSSLAGVDGRLKEKFHTQDFSYDQRL